jgi:rSAM/selenodomain-associated transferase 2
MAAKPISSASSGRISVIVPVLNEQEHLATTLAHVTLSPGDELIVVDGGSTDETVAIARRFTPTVLTSTAGRAQQMNCGAQQAQGDILLFLHADTHLPAAGLEAVRHVMQETRVVGGAFRLAFRPSTSTLRVIAWVANLRSRYARLPYGDQALFVRHDGFDALGGYPDVPFLEDVQLVQRLRRQGKMTLLPEPVHTSGRRWLQEGMVSTTLRNNLVMALYFCGVSPATLKRWYRSRRRAAA